MRPFSPRRLLALAIAAATVAPSSRARADGDTVGVTDAITVGPSECLRHDVLVAHVTTWLARDVVDRRIAVAVEDQGERVRFVVRRDGVASAERTFRATRIACADLRAAVGLAIALAIDATILKSITIAEPPPEPAPAPPQPPTVHAPARALREPLPAHRPPERPEPPSRLDVDVAALAAIGVLPGIAWGGAVGLSLRLDGPLAVAARAWGTSEADVALASGRAYVGMAAGELRACLVRDLGSAALRACAGGAAGRWSARGQGFDEDLAPELPWAAAVAGLEADAPLARGLAVTARLDGYAPFVRPVLDVHDDGGFRLGTAEAPAAGLVAAAGLRIGFW